MSWELEGGALLDGSGSIVFGQIRSDSHLGFAACSLHLERGAPAVPPTTPVARLKRARALKWGSDITLAHTVSQALVLYCSHVVSLCEK